MAVCLRKIGIFKNEILLFQCPSISRSKFCRFNSNELNEEETNSEEEFKVFQLIPKKESVKKKALAEIVRPKPRTEKMTFDQDWTNVWPGPKTFHPGVVPLPLRQGRIKKAPPPSKFCNTELMKIPNFLHLTPPAIKKHCEAIKGFCTEWPKNLNDNQIKKHFPVEVITSDYCHSSPSIRDPNARIVSLKINIDSLKLDKHAKDKFLRLVGKRYDPKTNTVTITTDSCPLRKQNYDYAQYLLTALYFESNKYEEWEKLKGDKDWETYIFDERKSKSNLNDLLKYNNTTVPDKTIKIYKTAVEKWHNEGDQEDIINEYKKAAMDLLSLPNLVKS